MFRPYSDDVACGEFDTEGEFTHFAAGVAKEQPAACGHASNVDERGSVPAFVFRIEIAVGVSMFSICNGEKYACFEARGECVACLR